MHSRSPAVIHQDIKPSNILVIRERFGITYLGVIFPLLVQVTEDLKDVYICDLGVAKLSNVGATLCTSKGEGAGTIPYKAPEMFHSARRGSAVDIYSFGCLLIELFGHKRVWGKLQQMEIMHKVCGSYQSQPESPNVQHIQPPLQDLCRKCTSLIPEDRPFIHQILNSLRDISFQ